MTFQIYCKYDAYRWVASCPDAGKDFTMRAPHGSARQAADDLALQLLGQELRSPQPKLTRIYPSRYSLELPNIPVT